MASQVLSGSGSVSYTNNTGQNVRVVINFMAASQTPQQLVSGSGIGILMTYAGISVSASLSAIGRNLAFYNVETTSNVSSNNAGKFFPTPTPFFGALPTEIMLAPGQTFTATQINQYNIVIIPENG